MTVRLSDRLAPFLDPLILGAVGRLRPHCAKEDTIFDMFGLLFVNSIERAGEVLSLDDSIRLLRQPMGARRRMIKSALTRLVTNGKLYRDAKGRYTAISLLDRLAIEAGPARPRRPGRAAPP